MGKWVSKKVCEFKEGDKIRLYGLTGKVIKVDPEIRDICGKRVECTYLTVHFDEDSIMQCGNQYQDGSFGGRNDMVGYGFYDETI